MADVTDETQDKKYSHGERCLLFFTPASNAEAMPNKSPQPCLSDSILLEVN